MAPWGKWAQYKLESRHIFRGVPRALSKRQPGPVFLPGIIAVLRLEIRCVWSVVNWRLYLVLLIAGDVEGVSNRELRLPKLESFNRFRIIAVFVLP